MSGPPAQKRLKLALPGIPVLDQLAKFHCSVPEPAGVSPGAVQGCRVAVKAMQRGTIIDTCCVLFASGRQVFSSELTLGQEARVLGVDGTCLASSSREAQTREFASLALPAEVQSLSLNESASTGQGLLAAVDCYGQAAVQPIDSSAMASGEALQLPAASSGMEPGWAGIAAASADEEAIIVTACQFEKRLTLYQSGRMLRSLGSLHQPHAVTHVTSPGRDCIALAEGHQVSVWDPRAGERRGCISRLNTGAACLPLYAVTGDATGQLLGAGGGESTVYVFDVRKGSGPLARWPSALKYDILSLHFPAQRSDYIFAGGMDLEVCCNLVESRARKAASHAPLNPNHSSRASTTTSGVSFRGDGRWLGIARAPSCDIVAGFAASQNMFIAKFSFSDGK